MKRNIILTTLIIVTQVVSAFVQENWKLQKDRDGIQVYSADFPDSKIRAIKVVALYEASPEDIADMVMDINAAPEWVSHLKTSYLVKQVSKNELYYYAEVSLPWPVSNRDFVAHLTRNEDMQTRAITIDGPAVTGFVPEKKGIVRINNSTGKWIITPLENNQVKVEYSLHVDPAGSIPTWLVNMFSGDAPMEIFQNLRKQLKHNGQVTTTAMLNTIGTK
jgi:ribosome-associated toxin RatA of RatAB toxin-antitoxin module